MGLLTVLDYATALAVSGATSRQAASAALIEPWAGGNVTVRVLGSGGTLRQVATLGPFTIGTDDARQVLHGARLAFTAYSTGDIERLEYRTGGGTAIFSIDAGGASVNFAGAIRALCPINLDAVAFTPDAGLPVEPLPPPDGPGIVTCDGDSITAGGGLTGGDTYPAQLDALLETSWEVFNVGINGQTCEQMQSTRDDADYYYNPSVGPTVLVCFGGTNDLYFGASATTVQDRIEAYCAASQTVGWKVIVCTLLPRNDFPGTSSIDKATHESRRQTVNAWLRSNWATFADALCDIGGNADIGQDGDEEDLTYYQSDKVHPNATGAGVIASLVAAKIGAAIGA